MSEAPPPVPAAPLRALRRHFAAGDFLTRYPEGSPHALLVDSPLDKPGWYPRVPSTFGKPPYPGTAIRFEGDHYEVVSTRMREGTFPRFYYLLDRWDERFPIRDPLPYTPEEAKRVAAERKAAARANRHAGALWLLTPLVGMLPADDQRRIENVYGLRALQMTFWSALALLPIGTWLSLQLLAAGLGGAGGGIPQQLLLLGPLLASESFFRLVAAWKVGVPIGSFLVALPIEFARALRRELDPAYRQRRFEQLKASGSGADVYRSATDEVLEVFGQEHDLVVTSILPKEHWGPQTGVLWKESWYVPIDSRVLSEGKRTRYRYLLKKVPEHLVFRSTCNYSPDEVRAIWRERRRRDLNTWAVSFAPFLGLAEEEEQLRIGEIYDYQPLKFTRISIWVLAGMSVASIGASVVNFGLGVGTPTDLVAALLSAWFLVECGLRRKTLSEGRPSGSVAGILVRPLVRRLLAD